MMQTFKCQKATFFVLDKRISDEFFSQQEPMPDKYRHYIHGIMYDDE